ncbi:MAG: hypothetical protein IPM25_09815 [Chloracidobacterium sp.]|nr:hypothetical protein [Chloracidobacterium sp.]
MAILIILIAVVSVRSQDDREYEKFLIKASEGFGARAEKLNKEFLLGGFGRWDYLQEDGKLRFSTGGVDVVLATAQIVGSYSTYSGTWMWSWANNSVDQKVKKDIGKVREFGSKNKFSELFEPKFACDEAYAWTLTKAAGEVLNARGAYRGKIPDGWVYFLITDIKRAAK